MVRNRKKKIADSTLIVYVLTTMIIGNTKWHSASMGSFAYTYAISNSIKMSQIDEGKFNYYYGKKSDCEPFSVDQECAPVRLSENVLDDLKYFQLVLNAVRHPCDFMFAGNKGEFQSNSSAQQAGRYLKCGTAKGVHIKVVLIFVTNEGNITSKLIVYPTWKE